jgi:hypothetical protein
MLKTPLHIQVGDIDTYSFISLMNLYDRCLDDPKYFDRLVEAATTDSNPLDRRNGNKPSMDRLGKFLLLDGQVLPRKCFVVLFTLLCNADIVVVVRKLLRKKYTWEAMQAYTPSKDSAEIWCAWPECPDEAS